MNRLLALPLIALLTLGTAGCGHEARITGVTQCFAPHPSGNAQAATGVRAQTEVGGSDVVATASN